MFMNKRNILYFIYFSIFSILIFVFNLLMANVYFVPYILSPASPNPGTIYLFSFNPLSTTAQ